MKTEGRNVFSLLIEASIINESARKSFCRHIGYYKMRRFYTPSWVRKCIMILKHTFIRSNLKMFKKIISHHIRFPYGIYGPIPKVYDRVYDYEQKHMYGYDIIDIFWGYFNGEPGESYRRIGFKKKEDFLTYKEFWIDNKYKFRIDRVAEFRLIRDIIDRVDSYTLYCSNGRKILYCFRDSETMNRISRYEDEMITMLQLAPLGLVETIEFKGTGLACQHIQKPLMYNITGDYHDLPYM